MIEIWKIEKVYKIIDREIAFIELKDMKEERRKAILRNWNFVRDAFREVCIQCAQHEGIVRVPKA